MVRKLNLIITILISMLLMPLPLYARGGAGGGHGGFGGHGFGGHGNFGNHGFWGHGGFTHGGFHTGHFGHGGFDHFGHGHFHHHGHFEEEEEENFLFASGLFLGLGFPIALYPFYDQFYYPYYYPPYYDYPYYDYPYYDQPYGDLEIEVAPEDVEIYVDGRFIGKANDFRGAAIVLVPSGTHVVGFRYNGSSSSTKVRVDPDSKSVIRQDFSEKVIYICSHSNRAYSWRSELICCQKLHAQGSECNNRKKYTTKE